jgi:hypothetical protein
VAKETKYHLGIEIDKLTNSIVNKISGDSFATDVLLSNEFDFKNTIDKNGWFFNCQNEYKLTDRQVFKLTILNNPEIIQGLLSLARGWWHTKRKKNVVGVPPTTEERKMCVSSRNTILIFQ